MIRFLFFTLVLTFTIMGVSAQKIDGSFIHNGVNRTYFYYISANYQPNNAVPLIINLHGHTSNNEQQELYTNFKPIADTAGFIMVYPQGTNSVYSQQPFWNCNIYLETADDIGFLNALIDTISAHHAIDVSRIYCTGMSNGGFMSYFMPLYSDRFAAIASVTGSMAKAENGVPPTPIPVMEIHGTADAAVPYNGDITMRPIEEVVNKWVQWNQCDPTPVVTQVPDVNTTDNAQAEHYLYQNGINGNTVEFYKIINGGHTWPGSPIPLITNGNTCMDFNASKEIWRFFSQYSRPDLLGTKTVKSFHLAVFPNPSTDKIILQTEINDYQIEIIDLNGKVVRSQSHLNQTEQIDVSNLQEGIYVLKAFNSKNSVEQKIVIEK